MSILALAKAAVNGFSGGDLGELLESLGMQVSMQPITIEDAPAALRMTALAAARKGASLHRMVGRMQSGETVEALIIMVPPGIPQKRNLHAEPNRAIVSAV